MAKLVFIDDDPEELDKMRPIVGDEYDYRPIPWPLDGSLEDAIGEPGPDIFVLDLYLPPGSGPASTVVPDDVRRGQTAIAEEVSGAAGSGTIWLRHRAWGARAPWYRIRLMRGRAVSAASFSSSSRGSKSRWLVPSLHGRLSSTSTRPSPRTRRRSWASGGCST